jgi:hypothetical protein
MESVHNRLTSKILYVTFFIEQKNIIISLIAVLGTLKLAGLYWHTFLGLIDKIIFAHFRWGNCRYFVVLEEDAKA